jgi:4-carboxymuconolactone decarboxylase
LEKDVKTSSSSRDQLRSVAPKLVELTEKVVFGDIWERPDLSKRERSLATVTALITSARWDQLDSHLERATNNGISKAEIFELITHLAFYAGWPSAMTAANKAKDFYEKRDAQK